MPFPDYKIEIADKDGVVAAAWPMVGFHRQMLEGAKEQSELTAHTARRVIEDPVNNGHLLVPDADPWEVLEAALKMVGEVGVLLRLDDVVKGDLTTKEIERS